MGTFTFKWPHAAEEVYVTGTFDNWEKSEQLEKVGDVFQKTVTLPDTSNKILYKFVVDGNWTTDHTAPQEKDHEGNDNNVLLPESISKMAEEANPAAAILNTVGPEATTVQLAGEVPLEKKEEKTEEPNPAAAAISTVGPHATTAQLAGEVPLEEKKEEKTKEKPVEAAVIAPPGGYPETPATELEKEVKIDPIPATDINSPPIKLAPGEKIPEGVVAGSIIDYVTLDKESYEKSDRLPGLETSDAPLDQLPPITNDLIPESSLPIVSGGDAAISTVGSDATTAKLAGEVPLEPKVPKIVKESQKEAHVDPEASAISEEVREKAEVEQELLSKVPEAPATSENATSVTGAIVAASAAVATAAVGAAIAAKDTVVDAATSAAEQLPAAAAATQETVTNVTNDVVDNKVPAAVEAAVGAKDSAVEAAVNVVEKLPEPVKEILPTATEKAPEVKEEIPVAPEVKEEAPVVAAAPVAAESPAEVKASEPAVAAEVPAPVKESIAEASASPEAAASAAAVEEKKEVDTELLKEVKLVEPVAEAAKPAESTPKAVAPVETKPVEPTPEASAPVKSKPEPTVEVPSAEEAKRAAAEHETNGTKAAAASEESATKPAGAPATTAEKKKKNRISAIFSKIKHKLEGKDKS